MGQIISTTEQKQGVKKEKKKKSNLLYLLFSNYLENKGLLQEPGIIDKQSLEVPYGGDMHQKLMN